jgi:hypothetical protein
MHPHKQSLDFELLPTGKYLTFALLTPMYYKFQDLEEMGV